MKTSQFLYEDFVKLTLGVLRLAQWYFPALNFRVTNTSLYTDRKRLKSIHRYTHFWVVQLQGEDVGWGVSP